METRHSSWALYLAEIVILEFFSSNLCRMLSPLPQPTVARFGSRNDFGRPAAALAAFSRQYASARPYGRALARVRLRTPVSKDAGLPTLPRACAPHLEVGRGLQKSLEPVMQSAPLLKPLVRRRPPEYGLVSLSNICNIGRARNAIASIAPPCWQQRLRTGCNRRAVAGRVDRGRIDERRGRPV